MRNKLSQEQRNKAIALVMCGCSYSFVSREFGVSPSVVSGYMATPKKDLTIHRQGGEGEFLKKYANIDAIVEYYAESGKVMDPYIDDLLNIY